MRSVIKEHRETYDDNNIRDLVDLYIQAERNNFEGIGVMDGEKYTSPVYDVVVSISKQCNLYLCV